MNFVPATLLNATSTLANVRLPDGSTIEVAADASALPAGAALTLGVRPEHVMANAQPLDNSVRSRVQLAEHLGDTTYLHVQLAGAADALTVRTDPDNPLASGDTAHLGLPARRCFLFDDQGHTLPQVA
jgi:multiple sugar transport system ATP-binding protein